MTDMPPRTMLSAAEVAKLLGRHKRVIQKQAKDGLIPAHQLPGATGAYLFDRAVIEQLMRDKEQAALQHA